MTIENITLALATSEAATSPEKTAALVVPRHDAMTSAELAQGKASKRLYLLGRVAAGESKAAALAEFETALAAHRVENKAALAALATLSTVAVARVTKTKTGWNCRLVDTTAAAAKTAAKAAALLEKYRAKVATLEAAAAAK
jgi:uncharacterized protein YciI